MQPFLVPLAAALLFPVATLALKRAMDMNRDPWGTLLVSNLAVAAAFLPIFALGASGPPGGAVWLPALAGILFVGAQIAAYRSFALGDLSVAVPAQGTKVLLVAGLTSLAGGEVGWRLWAAAGLTVAAIAFLQDRESASSEGGRRRLLATLGLALLASAGFAAFDVLVQECARDWGGARFGARAFLWGGALSFGLLALPGPRLRGHCARSWGWLLLGSGTMALITLGLVLVIGRHGQATLVNVLFNARCVTSVAFVWLAGRWFGNREARAGRAAMAHRLAGSGCMMAAVLLALL